MKRDKSLLLTGAVFAVLFIVWLLLGGSGEHIEDINGPDNYSLATIQERDFFTKGIKHAKGGPKTKTSSAHLFGITASSGTKYYSDKFSGIYYLQSWNFIGKSDLWFTLYNFEVTAGNFQMYLISEDEVIAKIEPGQEVYFEMRDLKKGLYELVIAGESAAFEFTSFDFDDDEY